MKCHPCRFPPVGAIARPIPAEARVFQPAVFVERSRASPWAGLLLVAGGFLQGQLDVGQAINQVVLLMGIGGLRAAK